MTPPRRIDVFFYGLFMDQDLLRARGVAPEDPRVAAVSGFELRIGSRATLLPSPGGRVFGVVASLSHEELERLYSEPSVQAYRAEAVLVQLGDGALLPALCYNLLEPPAPGEHDADYASRLRQLADRLGFPADYVASVR
jgi:hypothetical protein